MLIVKKLKAKPYSSYEEVQHYLDSQISYMQLQDESLIMGFSKRTLQRDIREIYQIFGIQIEYSKTAKGYFISDSETENTNFQRMMEAFDMFNSLNLAQDLTPFIQLEKRKPQGTENLYGLLHAIKNHLLIKFSYEKYWDEEMTSRTVEPYALKEFKNRWYLVAKDWKDGNIKSFALDRLTELAITTKSFPYPQNFNIEEHFRYCFGIISPNGQLPQEIILSFDALQGKYIKSLPLHDTQKIVIDTEEELQISLRLYISHDLVMELLSYGEHVKVLQPEGLVDIVKEANENASQQYR
jgi:predicted DNA-binding transcriptional regulator YafY